MKNDHELRLAAAFIADELNAMSGDLDVLDILYVLEKGNYNLVPVPEGMTSPALALTVAINRDRQERKRWVKV